MLHLIFFDTEDKLLKSKQTNKQTNKKSAKAWALEEETTNICISNIFDTFTNFFTTRDQCESLFTFDFRYVWSCFKAISDLCTIIRFLYCLNYTDSAIIFTIATGNFVTCIRGNFVGLNIFDPTDFNCWLQSWPFDKIGI